MGVEWVHLLLIQSYSTCKLTKDQTLLGTGPFVCSSVHWIPRWCFAGAGAGPGEGKGALAVMIISFRTQIHKEDGVVLDLPKHPLRSAIGPPTYLGIETSSEK